MILKIIYKMFSWVNDYSGMLLVILALATLVYVHEEFSLKIRPFITIKIVPRIEQDKWFFDVVLVNKGTYPGVARVTSAVLKIGDEIYPTPGGVSMVLAPNEENKIFPIGHINQIGRNKILGHEYKSNRFEIQVDAESGAVGDDKLKYKTVSEFSVDISGEKPVFILTSEKLT